MHYANTVHLVHHSTGRAIILAEGHTSALLFINDDSRVRNYPYFGDFCSKYHVRKKIEKSISILF